jgi:hypothetical protein
VIEAGSTESPVVVQVLSNEGRRDKSHGKGHHTYSNLLSKMLEYISRIRPKYHRQVILLRVCVLGKYLES